MKILTDIKAKVFAQYLGQKIDNGKILSGSVLTDRFFALDESEERYRELKLILKPLSAITEPQLLEIAKLYHPDAFNVSFNINTGELVWTYMVMENVKQRAMIPIEDSAKAYQWFLQNGFDTKQILLGGKTLNEAGLAIYEK